MLVIGEIVAAHGLRGEVRVQPLTDIPERFAELEQVWLSGARGARMEMRVLGAKSHATKSLVILRLAGVNDREAARRLVGNVLGIAQDQAGELPEDVFYEDDIIGLEVETTEGRDLGRITEIIRTGANDVYVTPACLIPAIGDVVRSIDVASGRMVIEAVPGLLEE